MITSSITLGSIVFGDVEFEGWSFSELIDWWGQTEDKLEVVERPQAHGAFDVNRSLRTSRAISFTGTFIGPAQADVENAFDDLASVGAEGPVDMVVSTPAGATMRTVTVESVTPVDHRGRKYGRYSVDLIARDPRRYDVNAQSESTTPVQPGQGRTWPAVWPLVWPGGGSSGRITLTNTGKAPSAPTFILSGGFDTALITCLETGARIGLNRQVPVGSEVVIDTKARRATIDGQSDVSRWLQYREWELIPPGASRTYQFDATGVVSNVAEVRRNYTQDPRFTNMTNWALIGTSSAVSTDGAITATIGPTPPTSNFLTPAQLSWYAAAPGETVSAAYLVENLGASTATFRVALFDGSQYVYGAIETLTAGEARRVSATATTPAGASYQQPRLHTTGVSAGAVIRISQPMWEKASMVGPYFDPVVGSGKPDLTASWAGAANASPVILSQATVYAILEGQVRSAWW